MIILNTTSKKLQIVLSGTPSSELPYVAAWADMTTATGATPGAGDGTTNSTTAVDVVPAPASSTERKLEFLSVYNSAGAAYTVSVQLYNGSSTRVIVGVVLTPGEHLHYTDKDGFYVLDLNGAKLAVEPSTATPVLMEGSATQRIFRSPLGPVASGFLLISGTAYFVYLGRSLFPFTPQYVESYLGVFAVGTQVCEVGIFSTPQAPNGGTQTLTKLASTATYDGLTSSSTLGVKRNTGAALATVVPANTHLWVGMRAAFTSAPTQPSFQGLMYDNSMGELLLTAGSTAFASGTTYTGALQAAQTGVGSPVVCAPDLQLTLD